MKWTEENTNLQFDRPRIGLPRRIPTVGITLIAFSLLWNYVPQSTLFWILFFCLGIFAWISTYGWRQAVVVLIYFLNKIEQF